MSMGNAGVAVALERAPSTTHQIKTFLSRYFYFCMSLVVAAMVVWGFSKTVDANLIHANPRRPVLLWMHGTAFSTWLVLFIVQSGLLRVRKVSWHRFLGWFGSGLASAMVVLGISVALVMTRFDTVGLHQTDAEPFLSIPFYDMMAFGTCMALAILWRKRPEYHRRLVFIATCGLVDAGIGRFAFWYNHSLFFLFVDFLILLGVLRDLVVDGRVHKVYRYALPSLILGQSLTVYAWRANPGWWRAITHAILW
jgi:FtsH-binding integral membrane protein